MKPFIGLKKIWYGDVITTDLSAAPAVESMTEVKNVHQGTWGYSQDDPSITDYVNELTGRTYYRDAESAGAKTISFSMGEYDYADMAALEGGSVISTKGWKATDGVQVINKAVVALTKTNQYIVFTNASIIAKVDTQNKNLCLGVTATAQENPNEGVAPEYWFDATA